MVSTWEQMSSFLFSFISIQDHWYKFLIATKLYGSRTIFEKDDLCVLSLWCFIVGDFVSWYRMEIHIDYWEKIIFFSNTKVNFRGQEKLKKKTIIRRLNFPTCLDWKRAMWGLLLIYDKITCIFLTHGTVCLINSWQKKAHTETSLY